MTAMRQLFAVFLLGAAVAPLAADPVISEFMAQNLTTIKDGYGKYEDWIEIWNPDATSVNLAGWRLTDNKSNLGKFVFPSCTLAPGARLVVFASNRSGSTGASTHIDPLGYFHTNFALSKDGEYLAMVKPDGVTKTTELDPFPPQPGDVSYGPPATVEEMVNQTTAIRFKAPIDATDDTANPNWTQPGFTDSAWTASTGSGVGFEVGSPAGAWWMDEAAGATTALDATGSGLNATLNGTGQSFGESGASAMTSTAVRFNGSGGLTVPYSASLNPPVSFTFCAWVYPTGGSGYRAVVSSRVGPAGSQRGYLLYLTPDNKWEFWTGTTAGGGTWNILSGGSATLNAWTHLAITRDATGVKRIYKNGVLRASSTQGYQPNNNPANGFHLGCGDDTGTQFRFTGKIDDAAFWGSDIGAALIDQHRLSGAGTFPTPLYAAHFQTNVQETVRGTSTGLYTRHSFTVTDRTRFSALRLRVKYDDGFVAYLNGTEILRRNVSGTRTFDSVAGLDRAENQAVVFEDADVTAAALPVLTNGTNILAIHGLTFASAATDFLLTPVLDATLTPSAQVPGYFSAATPGGPNAATTVSPGPALSDVVHSPAQPAAATAITVTARVTPRLAAIASVALIYRVNYGAESAAIAMTNSGAYPGATDGSRLFTGTIPASHGAAVRQMLRYYLVATDTAGRTWRAPYPVDLTNDDGVSQSPQYFGTVIADPSLTASMPIMQWFTNDVPNSDTRIGSRASVWYEGRFYDNMYVRQRGGYTSYGSQKFNFNANDGVWVNETLGTVGELNMNTSGADANQFRTSLAFAVYRAAGSPASESFPVAMVRNGAVHRIAHCVEQVDEDFLSRNGLARDGALYKFVQRLGEESTPGNVVGGDYSGSPGFKFENPIYGVEKKTRLYEDFSDYTAFTAGINPANSLADRKTFLFRNLNLPNFVNFMAVRALISEGDVNRKNFYALRDTTASQEWFLFPWDKDLTFGVYYSSDPSTNLNNPWQATNTFKHDPNSTRQWCVLWQTGYDLPEVRAMVGRRLRTLTDNMLGAPGTAIPGYTPMEQLLEALRTNLSVPPTGFSADGNYANRSSFNSWLGLHRTDLFTIYGPSSSYGMIPEAAAATPTVDLAGCDANPAAATPGFSPQDHEFLVMTNPNPEDVDLSGWTLWNPGADGPMFAFASGTVIPGSGNAPLNQLHVARNLPGFRQRPGAPASAEFVVGPYDGQISARGETVELRAGGLATSRLVSTLSTPVDPTPSQQFLRITELMYMPAAPTAGELALAPGTEAKDYEFIELQNIGPASLDLTGARFTDGVEFTFPSTVLAPGQRVLVVANATAFAARYGAGFLIAGAFSGALDNSGERIRIEDASGEMVLDFSYDDRWFPAANGSGRSLVVREAAPDFASYDQPAQWALSGGVGGSPGAADADGFAHSYAGWIWDHFSPSEIDLPNPPNPPETLNTAMVGAEADPDGDGLSNLAEYAFGRNPRVADNGALAEAMIANEAGVRYPAVVFVRPHLALDLAYGVETAPTLNGPWAADAVIHGTAADLGNGYERVTFRSPLPLPAAASRFLRVRVSQNSP